MKRGLGESGTAPCVVQEWRPALHPCGHERGLHPPSPSPRPLVGFHPRKELVTGKEVFGLAKVEDVRSAGFNPEVGYYDYRPTDQCLQIDGGPPGHKEVLVCAHN